MGGRRTRAARAKRGTPMLAPLLALGLIAGAPGNPMRWVSSAEGRFGIWFPGEAKHQVVDLPTKVGTIQAHFFLVEQPTRAYMVGYSDYPDEVLQNPVKDV